MTDLASVLLKFGDKWQITLVWFVDVEERKCSQGRSKLFASEDVIRRTYNGGGINAATEVSEDR